MDQAPIDQVIGDAYVHDFYLTEADGVTALDLTDQTFSAKVLNRWAGDEIAVAGMVVSVEEPLTGRVRIYIPVADVAALAALDRNVVIRLRWDDTETTFLSWEVRFTA